MSGERLGGFLRVLRQGVAQKVPLAQVSRSIDLLPWDE